MKSDLKYYFESYLKRYRPFLILGILPYSKKISDTKTLIVNQQEFQFSGLMKIVAFFQPSGFNLDAFKKQSNIYLNSFKNFVENTDKD